MINVVLRTCDKTSLETSRIVNKKECVLRCTNSIIRSLENVKNKRLHIIDHNSSKDLKKNF